jgi:hypothetical protein
VSWYLIVMWAWICGLPIAALAGKHLIGHLSFGTWLAALIGWPVSFIVDGLAALYDLWRSRS